MEVKKSKTKKSELTPVPVTEAQVGQVISLHGKILSTKRMKGRSLWSKWVKRGKGKVRNFKHGHKQPAGFKLHAEGQEGILFTTTTGEYFYPLDANVWMVR
jgi:hypothetical protein